MKKMRVLLAVLPALFTVLGCDLIPKAIEVRAAPKVPIKNMGEIDIKSELWNALYGNVPGSIALAENKDDGNMVLVVKKEIFNINQQKLFEEVIKLKVGPNNQQLSQLFSGTGVTLSLNDLGSILGSTNAVVTGVLNTQINAQELTDAVNNIDKITLPSIDNLDDILNGFAFTDDASGALFLYDINNPTANATTSVFDLLGYQYKINSGVFTDGTINKMPDEYNNIVWNDKGKTSEYYKPLQGKGVVIDKLFNNGNLDADFKVSLKSSTTIRDLLGRLNDLDQIKAEIIAWVPLVFEARSNDAYFKISIEKALGEGDLFFRGEGEEGEEKQDFELEIKYLNVEVAFSIDKFNEMFNGKWVEIGNNENNNFVPFQRQIKENKLIISFDKEIMDTIYEDPLNNPFVPTLKVLFKPEDAKQLFIPYELKISDAYIEFGVVASFDLEGKK
jgi:hypothetical protein